MERIYTYCVHRFLCTIKSTSHAKKTNRNFSTSSIVHKTRGSMQAWQIHKYGNNDELKCDSLKIPGIRNPASVLVRIHAASINPIDCRMRSGYGSTALNAIRQKTIFPTSGKEFPLILGRDFSGEVVETGKQVKKYKPGDQVWGTVFGSKQGCLAEYTVADEHEMSLKPASISHTKASSIPYVACTVASALGVIGGLRESTIWGKRVLVFGGSGGIGTFAIQALKAYGADVTTTCSTDALELVTSLGPDLVIDYKTQNVNEELSKAEKFDIILDSFGKENTGYAIKYLKRTNTASSKYITLRHPFLANFDNYGLVGGGVRNVMDAAMDTITSLQSGASHRWAVALPLGNFLGRISKLVDDDQIIPIIDKSFTFEEVPDAFQKVESGHARGKTVIQVVQDSTKSDTGKGEN